LEFSKFTTKGVHLYRYASSDPKTISEKGEVLCFISANSEKDVDYDTVIKLVWDGIIDRYLEIDYPGILGGLKSAMKAGESKLRTLIKRDDKFKDSGINLDFVLLVESAGKLYFARFGNQAILLWRDGKYIDVGSYLSKSKAEGGSTLIQTNDVVVLATEDVLGELKEKDFSIDYVKLLASEKGNRGAVVFFKNKAVLGEVEEESAEKSEADEEVREESDTLEDKSEGLKAELGEPTMSTDDLAGESEEKKDSENLEQKEIESKEVEHKEVPKDDVVFAPPKQTEKTDSKKNLGMKEKKESLMKKVDKVGSVVGTGLDFAGDVFKKVSTFLVKLLGVSFGRQIWYKRLTAKLSQSRISLGGTPNIRISGYKDKARRNKMLGFIALLIVVSIVGVIGYKYTQKIKHEKDIHTQVVAKISEAQARMEEAERIARSDQEMAQSKVLEVNQLLKDAKGMAIYESDLIDIAALESEVVNVDDQVNLRVALDEGSNNISVYKDGKLQFGINSNPADITLMETTSGSDVLFVSDEGEKAVYRIATYNDSVLKVPDSNKLLQSPKFLDFGMKGLYVYDAGAGVVVSPFDDAKKNSDFRNLGGQSLSADSLSDKKIQDLAIFTQNDNVYLVSQEDEGVLKSIRHDGYSYGLAISFLSDDKMAKGNDIFADSSYVYMLSEEAPGLFRYETQSGVLVENSVDILGVSPELSGISAGCIGVSSPKIYMFDNNNKRIIVVEKQTDSDVLVMTKQYVYRGKTEGVFDNVKDLVVDHRDSYMYVLDGVRIWRIKL